MNSDVADGMLAADMDPMVRASLGRRILTPFLVLGIEDASVRA